MPPSLGWIVQPSVLEVPEGVDHSTWEFARQVVEADERHVELALEAGFDSIWVEDHMGWGDKSHLECLTTLAWLAGRYPGPRYGTVVIGQAFRNPAYLAKVAVNLQLLTKGRFILGIGAGNNAVEHEAFGFPFLPAKERLDQTEEAIRIVQALWSGEHETIHGRHYRIEGAQVTPRPHPRIPTMIGGGGERRTLRLAARYADWWCADVGPLETFVHKSAVLDGHCGELGRDPASVKRAQVAWISVEDDPERVVRWPDLHIVAGSPGDVAAELIAFRRAGVDHIPLRFMDFPSTDGLCRFAEKVMPRLADAWE